MKAFFSKFKSTFSSLLVAVFLWPIPSWALTVQEVPNPKLVNGGWVRELPESLSETTEAQLNQMISQLDRIIDTQIVPRFKQEDFESGTLVGIKAIRAILLEANVEESQGQTNLKRNSDRGWYIYLVVAGLALTVLFWGIFEEGDSGGGFFGDNGSDGGNGGGFGGGGDGGGFEASAPLR